MTAKMQKLQKLQFAELTAKMQKPYLGFCIAAVQCRVTQKESR